VISWCGEGFADRGDHRRDVAVERFEAMHRFSVLVENGDEIGVCEVLLHLLVFEIQRHGEVAHSIGVAVEQRPARGRELAFFGKLRENLRRVARGVYGEENETDAIRIGPERCLNALNVADDARAGVGTRRA
jgi:hypothetical protein